MAEDLAQTKNLATNSKRILADVKDEERMSFSWFKQFKAYLAKAHKKRVEKKMLKNNDNFIRH
ncbi:hypothetical protein PC128_g17960 [Phytophthora cactorum]|nr:hypothetical protein PC120_g10511 [Phytophthora cactorum]KAG3174791.1 hypothetical protein PC128_g17960 [Phytophthora cactorum]